MILIDHKLYKQDGTFQNLKVEKRQTTYVNQDIWEPRLCGLIGFIITKNSLVAYMISNAQQEAWSLEVVFTNMSKKNGFIILQMDLKKMCYKINT